MHTILGAVTLACSIVINLRPEKSWLRTMLLGYVSTAPVPVFFITLERCMTLKYASGNIYKARQITLVLSIVLIIFIICGNTALNYAMIFMELDKPGNCTMFLCFIVQNQLLPNIVEKAAFATINLVFSFYFFYLIRKEQALNIRNYVVKATLIMEIAFVILPSYSSALYTMVVGEPSTSLLGTYVTMFCMIDVCGCSIIYSIAFLKKKRRQHVASIVSLHISVHTPANSSKN
uniref:G-protein coupled receptors family 1 profile domain-containing protein n=1 Tax=Ditylenchus dipsaci TaxID=166011 RepID=A0A915DSC8_9BILA